VQNENTLFLIVFRATLKPDHPLEILRGHMEPIRPMNTKQILGSLKAFDTALKEAAIEEDF